MLSGSLATFTAASPASPALGRGCVGRRGVGATAKFMVGSIAVGFCTKGDRIVLHCERSRAAGADPTLSRRSAVGSADERGVGRQRHGRRAACGARSAAGRAACEGWASRDAGDAYGRAAAGAHVMHGNGGGVEADGLVQRCPGRTSVTGLGTPWRRCLRLVSSLRLRLLRLPRLPLGRSLAYWLHPQRRSCSGHYSSRGHGACMPVLREGAFDGER